MAWDDMTPVVDAILCFGLAEWRKEEEEEELSEPPEVVTGGRGCASMYNFYHLEHGTPFVLFRPNLSVATAWYRRLEGVARRKCVFVLSSLVSSSSCFRRRCSFLRTGVGSLCVWCWVGRFWR